MKETLMQIKPTMKRVVMTGPTGTIGMAFIEKCITEKVEVLALCRNGSENIENIPMSEFVEVLECDLSELSHFNSQKQYDVFYHLAWDGTIGDTRNNASVQHKNIEYTMDAVHLAKRLGCHTFIGAGSQAEYGRSEEPLGPTTPTFPENEYGRAKLLAGQKSSALCNFLGMNHIWVRIFSVYGPFDDLDTMIMTTISKLLNREVPKCTAGDQIWDYLFSEDAARALYLLGGNGLDGKTYCLGSGEARQLKEYIAILRKQINEEADVALGAIPYYENQIMYLCANINELKADVGFSPEVSFEEGIRKTILSLQKK